MKDSKLIRHLTALDPLELNRFEKFVKSPYFNTHADTIRLLMVLRKHYPHFAEDKIARKRIFDQLFPQEPFSQSRLNLLIKNLLQLCNQFFVIEESKTQTEYKEETLLLHALSKRGLDQYIPQTLQKASKRLADHPYRDQNFYYQSFQLEALKAEFSFAENSRQVELGLQGVHQNLDYFYLSQKLKYACVILTRQQFLAEESRIELLEEVKQYCSGKQFEAAPVIYLYFQVLRLLTEEEEESPYRELFAHLPQHYQLLPKDEVIELYVLLINYCNQRYKGGTASFLGEMLAVYRQMLALDLLFEEEAQAQASAHYKNIATLGIKLKEFTWTEQFLAQYQDRLDPKYRDGVMHYSLAYLHYEQGHYPKALQNLLRVAFIDAFHRMNYYILMLKTYYELDEIEPLFSLCNTFGMYVRRNKQLSDQNRSAYLALSRFARKLARIKYGESSKLKKLQKEIAHCQFLVERAWLEGKLGELLG